MQKHSTPESHPDNSNGVVSGRRRQSGRAATQSDELTDEIVVPDRMRSRISESAVDGLMESIRRIGLRTPITVRTDFEADATFLVSGLHRLEACKRLKWEFIPCIEFEGSETEAKLWEISENLHRADLTVVERSEHIAEWIRITDERNIGATCTGIPRGRGQPKGGIRAAERDLGIEHTEAVRAVKIDGLTPEAKAAAKEGGLDDNQAALLRVAEEKNAAAQLNAIKREKDKSEARKANREATREIALTEAQQFAEWLMAKTDVSHLPMLISWLEGCKPRDVIAALRRGCAP